MEYYQPKLDFGESAEALRAADTRIRAERARAFEAAAERLGMRSGEVGYILAGMLAVYSDSPSMRERGLTGLRWQGSTMELAQDRRLRCSVDSVKRVLRRFEAAGYITRRAISDDRGRAAGVEIELQMRAIHAGANLDFERDAVVGTEGVTYQCIDRCTDQCIDQCKSTSLLIPSLPNIPKDPPPRETRTEQPVLAAGQPGRKPTAAAGVFSYPITTADWSDEWKSISRELSGIGVERPIAATNDAIMRGMEPADVRLIMDTYRRHRSQFKSAGAIVARIRSGDWAAQLPDPEAAARATAHRERNRSALEYEKARSRVIRQAQQDGTWSQLTEAEIDARARASLEMHA